MGQLRTANKRHKRAIVATAARVKAAAEAPAPDPKVKKAAA